MGASKELFIHERIKQQAEDDYQPIMKGHKIQEVINQIKEEKNEQVKSNN